MTDTEFFNEALHAYAERTGFAGKFSDLPVEEMSLVIRDAQTLKAAARIRSEAIKFEVAQSMYPGEKL